MKGGLRRTTDYCVNCQVWKERFWVAIAILLLVTAMSLSGCCEKGKLDYKEAMSYREIIVTDLETIVHEAYGVRADQIAAAMQKDGGKRQSHAEQEEFDDCVATCMEPQVIPCGTDTECWERNGEIEEECEMRCEHKLDWSIPPLTSRSY